MYVAMTRAKKELFISKATERFQYWKYVTNVESRFLKEINPDYIENYSFSDNSNYFSSNPQVPNHPNEVFKIKKNKVENNVWDFWIGDKVSHSKFGFWNIISLNWDIAEIKFGVNWIKKMNIRIAPVKKM